MPYYTYHDNPQEIDTSHVLVFGTSLKGDLKLGYGPIAYAKHGAQKNKPMGFNSRGGSGSSFGIPLKTEEGFDLRTNTILLNIDDFITFSSKSKQLKFHITNMDILCPRLQKGIIPYLFKGCHNNCIFPKEWEQFIEPEPNLIEEKLELKTGDLLHWIYE